MEKKLSISGWINEKPPRGKYTFTHDDVVSAFPEMSNGTLARSLTREVSKGRIISPLRGFYVIIPEEYRLRGTVPQSLYLDDMMRHLGRKYYVALLSAAEMHGAAHQAPMSFFVMIEPPSMRDKETDKYKTLFVCKKQIADKYVETRQTRTGYINVSCPELTAVDLITYQTKVGSVTRAATVLAELVEKTDFSRLSPDFVDCVPISSLQRLGYIFENVLEERKAAEDVFGLLKHAGVQLQPVLLRAGSITDGFKKDGKWKVIVNVEIEIDEL
ncbi:MAG: type IV toxin-antitoxin system AbiEi family antitoxin [Bacteroidales bacterium]|nr:type IV toxin-antitoxin system AbiEi family antitoxin [Bacteroidales bacterium]MBR5676899.1 type IV toxin-antitoxin system AbiEi family antitoxin [Paludibacteraceae bacterium]